MSIINVKIKLDEDAQMPILATDGSAGYDFYPKLGYTNTVALGGAIVIDLGVSMEIPKGKALLLLSRSGHGFKKDVRLANCVGLIDSDYRGNIMVKLRSDDFDCFHDGLVIDNNTAIVQGVFIDHHKVMFQLVDALDDTDRGIGGFGSTDKLAV